MYDHKLQLCKSDNCHWNNKLSNPRSGGNNGTGCCKNFDVENCLCVGSGKAEEDNANDSEEKGVMFNQSQPATSAGCGFGCVPRFFQSYHYIHACSLWLPEGYASAVQSCCIFGRWNPRSRNVIRSCHFQQFSLYHHTCPVYCRAWRHFRENQLSLGCPMLHLTASPLTSLCILILEAISQKSFR